MKKRGNSRLFTNKKGSINHRFTDHFFPKGKKGFIFSLFVISIISLVILNFRMNEGFREAERAESFENRVKQINAFIYDVENDMERAVIVTTRNGLKAWVEAISVDRHPSQLADWANPPPQEDIDYWFRALLVEGQPTVTPGVEVPMEWTTLNKWRDNISKLSINNFGVDMIIEMEKVYVKQDNPWELNVTVFTVVEVKDLSNIIRWTFEFNKSYPVSLEGLPDPFYVHNINRLVGKNHLNPDLWNKFNQTPYTNFWTNLTTHGDLGYDPTSSTYLDLSNLQDHMKKGYYVKDSNRPSYLMRLWNVLDCTAHQRWTDECNKAGVESMIDIEDSDIKQYWQKSGNNNPPPNSNPYPCVIDVQFGSDPDAPTTPICGSLWGHNIVQMQHTSPPPGMPAHPVTDIDFMLDDSDLAQYGLTKLNTT